MSHRTIQDISCRIFAAGLLLALGLAPAAASGPPAAPHPEAVARSVGPAGRLIRRQGDATNPWQLVDDKETVDAGDLLIGLPGAEVETTDGSVGLRLVKFVDSPLPVLEPAATLHKGAGFDLDFTLERGMVEVANRKEKGGVRVRIRARDETWTATLEGPGARLLVELYGGWPKGARFHKRPGPKKRAARGNHLPRPQRRCGPRT